MADAGRETGASAVRNAADRPASPAGRTAEAGQPAPSLDMGDASSFGLLAWNCLP